MENKGETGNKQEVLGMGNLCLCVAWHKVALYVKAAQK